MFSLASASWSCRRNDGTYLRGWSSKAILPSLTVSATAMAVNCLVTEPTANTVSSVTGSGASVLR